jgi:hypothetical protein
MDPIQPQDWSILDKIEKLPMMRVSTIAITNPNRPGVNRLIEHGFLVRLQGHDRSGWATDFVTRTDLPKPPGV